MLTARPVIRTPDQRLRVFVSSTLQELADERVAAAQAIRHLRLTPVMFELGARPHAPRALYRAYLDQSDVFVGVYWQRYGWVAPEEDVSGLEDEYRLATSKPKLIYVKNPAPEREPRLKTLLERIRDDDHASYKAFSTLAELRALLQNDLALLLSERFAQTTPHAQAAQAPVVATAPLPAPAGSFVGRDQEVRFVRDLLRHRDTRLVTLSGPGGVGKTRLSIEVARGLARTFPDGIAFVSLASVSDAQLVLATMAQQLGAREHGAARPVERVAEHVRGRRMLLVLDNFEQVVDAAPELAELLATCPELTLLVTSRTALRLRGEREVVVHPLDVAAGARLEGQSPAVRLFVDRARALNPAFADDPSELAAVAAICRRLDGLPLAIELASARAKVLSAEAMLTRLDDSLRFLTGAVRDLPARQQTLRRTLDWSYDLLSEPERTLFARLSVFAGGWTLEAAEQVCACDGVEVLETLQSLVDRSLINVQHAGAPSKQRFSMLATIREYARERLEATPAAGSVLAAHARYMLDLAEGAAARLRGAEQDAWRQRLSLEQDNVRAALRWLLDSGELDMASRLEMALTVFWWVQGYGSEARRWSDELLSREATLQPAARARAHLGSGLAAAWEGDYGRAVSLLEQAVAEFRPLGDARGAGVAQMALAYVSPLLDDYQRRESLLLESAADLFQAGDLWAVNVALQSRAEVALAAGDAARARELYQDSLELAQGQVDTRGRAQALLGLGFVELSRGDATAAAALLRQCVPFSLELGNLELLARALRGLASVADSQRQFDRAAHLLGAAHALSEAAGIVDWPIRRGLYAGTEQHVRDQLGRARFAATWAAGQRLTMTEAAAYALRMGGVKASAASQSRATAAVQDWSSEPSGSAVNGSKYLVQFCGGHNRTLWADDARGADHRVQGRTAVRAGRFSARSH